MDPPAARAPLHPTAWQPHSPSLYPLRISSLLPTALSSPLTLQVVVTSAVVRLEDYSHSGSPFGIEIAMDSLWFHPAHVNSADASNQTPLPVGSRSGGDAPPFRHREVLVCALCAYMLQGTKLEAEPARRPLGLEELKRRLESSGLAVDAPAAMRLNENACMLEPVSFAVEVSPISHRVWCE